MVTKKISKEIIEKIREEIMDGKSKSKTALEYGVNPKTVYRLTQDLPGGQYGWSGIRGKTLMMLQEILQNGYILSSKMQAGDKYYILKKYFPNIIRINMCNKSILFLDDKASIAAKAFISNIGKKIMSFQELKQITKVFGIELTGEEKHQIVGKNCKNVFPVTRRKDGGFMSSYNNKQFKIDDFLSDNDFIGKNDFKLVSKNHNTNEVSYLEKDDSLAFFYIRKYCNLK
jgi:hypothetical protein